MSEALSSRGPDDQATWLDLEAGIGFGFRRLAIQDLSAAGRQPMVSRSGRWVVVFNGEIYNHPELRAELGGTWRGRSDTETLLEAVEHWGVDATLDRLDGMFAIALWDRLKRQLTLVRDRMGIKPLYFAEWRGGIAFASELKALRRLPGVGASLDADAISSYLAHLYVPAPRTPFSDVRKLRPGHLLRTSSSPQPECWWSLKGHASRASDLRTRGEGPCRDESAILDEAERLLASSVRKRLLADVPVGVLLSGGVDSTLITALMAKAAEGNVRTFTAGFASETHDESPFARQIACRLGTDHSELTVTEDEALQTLPRMGEVFDEPFANPSNIPTYLISRLASQSVKVALSGDGGDELFAGYNRYLSGPALARTLSRIPVPFRRAIARSAVFAPRGTVRKLGARSPFGGGIRLADEKLSKIARMASMDFPGEMYATLLTVWDSPGRFLKRGWDVDVLNDTEASIDSSLTLDSLLLRDQLTYLPDDLLCKVDRSSMAVGLEVRVPLLDHALVEYSWTLADRFKIRQGKGKWLLRRLLERVVPGMELDRPKTGFTVPIESWLRGDLREWARGMLLDETRHDDELLSRQEVERVWRRFEAGSGGVSALGIWALIQLQVWRVHHGDMRK